MTNKLPKLLALATFSVALFTILSTSSASAATINVTTTDNPASTNDADCTLREAIENINTQTNAVNTDCAAGDGSTDTIIIPSGNIILEADLPQITTSMIIQGAGMGQTVIDGGGAWQGFDLQNSGSVGVNRLSIMGYADFGVNSQQTNMVIDQVEVDGTGAVFPTGPNTNAFGIVISNDAAVQIEASVTNTYVHNIMANGTATVFPLLITAGDSSTGTSEGVQAIVNNVTVADITGSDTVFGLLVGVGMYSAGAGVGVVNITVSNSTVTNIHSTAGVAAGVVIPILSSMSREVTIAARNITITNIRGTIGSPVIGGGSAAGLVIMTGGFVDGLLNTVNLNTTNLLIADTNRGCLAVDVSSAVFATNSTAAYNVTSAGGNLSDDASCAPYFTQPTDQNNVAALAASLLPLADNGGDVPTMALKEGSPAVDSGITVSGLTTDARQAARPQGSAYDSGAYESPYTKPAAVLAKSGQGIVVNLVVSSTVLLGLGVGIVRKQFNY